MLGQGSEDGLSAEDAAADLANFKILRTLRVFRLIKLVRLVRASRIAKR